MLMRHFNTSKCPHTMLIKLHGRTKLMNGLVMLPSLLHKQKRISTDHPSEICTPKFNPISRLFQKRRKLPKKLSIIAKSKSKLRKSRSKRNLLPLMTRLFSKKANNLLLR